MNRKVIIEALKQLKPLPDSQNGPVSIFIKDSKSNKSKGFSMQSNNDFIILTTGRFIFRHKYKIYKSEL